MNPLSTAWIILVVAGIFEIGWPVGLKMAQSPGRVIPGIIIAAFCMIVSSWLIWLAQKQIPMGTAYAVWTGIGAAGTFIVGVHFFGDPAGLMRYFGVALIVVGVMVLKLAH